MSKKNILLVLTGGTFGMKSVKGHVQLSNVSGKEILKQVPELNEIANISWISILNKDSSNMLPQDWINIGETIKTNYEKYDGFVVIHGTDTMVYSATSLSFIMGGTTKPIIFTGSQKPLSSIRTDARNNLIGAVIFATYNLPEVALFFNDKLLRGNRAKKTSIEDYDAFHSFNYPILGEIGINIEINREYIGSPKTPKWEFSFEQDILLLKVFPGFNVDLLYPALNYTNIKGLVIEGFGAGHVPEEGARWFQLIEAFTKKDKVVVIASQSPKGRVDLDLYPNGRRALKSGAIGGYDMTTEAIVVKLMFALGLAKKYNWDTDKVKDFIIKPYNGEMSNVL